MSEPRFSEPRDFDEACEVLLDPQDNAVALAGGTWLMRSRLRQERIADHIVSLGRIPDLQQVNFSDDGSLHIGSMVTHSRLALATIGKPELGSLHTAAAKSANPNVRNVATLGGNICAKGFSAADLVPALLSLDAVVTFADADGGHARTLSQFLQMPPAARIIHSIRIPPRKGFGAHIRLPLHSEGDYPVAIVTGVVELAGGVLANAAISLGSVEESPRRWTDLEQALIGEPLDAIHAENKAKTLLQGLNARTSVGTPGEYRVAVTPSLVRKFIEATHSAAAWKLEAAAS
jgi:carbon-monoxide dehydrogenase medium subunit